MPIKLLIELIAAGTALLCFAIAARAFLGFIKINRVAKHALALENALETGAEKPLRRAS